MVLVLKRAPALVREKCFKNYSSGSKYNNRKMHRVLRGCRGKGILTQPKSGTITEGGVPVRWVKSMELFPLGRQKLGTLYSFLEVFTNGIKPKKAI